LGFGASSRVTVVRKSAVWDGLSQQQKPSRLRGLGDGHGLIAGDEHGRDGRADLGANRSALFILSRES